MKSRDITLLTKVCVVKAMVFPVVMYGCKSWTIKKAECQRIDAFKLWCWRRILKVPWTVRRTNYSILRKINPEFSLEGLTLKLKLRILAIWCEQLTHWKSPWCWERLKAEGKRASEDEMAGWHHQCNGCKLGLTSRDGKRQRGMVCCSPWGRKESDTTEGLIWSDLIVSHSFIFLYPVQISWIIMKWSRG